MGDAFCFAFMLMAAFGTCQKGEIEESRPAVLDTEVVDEAIIADAQGAAGSNDTSLYKVAVRGVNREFQDGKLRSILITLKITGPDTGLVKHVEIVVDEATAGDGTSLAVVPETQGRPRAGGKPGVLSSIASTAEAGGFIRLKIPDDRAVPVVGTLKGKIRLSMPAKNPEMVVTGRFQKDSDVELTDKVLRDAGIEVTLKKPRVNLGLNDQENVFATWQFDFVAKDPEARLIASELIDGDGRVVHPSATASGPGFIPPDGDVRHLPHPATMLFAYAPPEAIGVRFFVFDETTVLELPFDLENIPVR